MTKTAVVKTAPASLEMQAAKWIEKREKILTDAAAIEKVESAHDLEISGGVQSALEKHIKTLSKRRLELTRPLDKTKKNIMDQEKAMVADLTKEQVRIKKMNDTYATKAEEDRQAVIQAQREAEAATTIQEAEAQNAEPETSSAFGGVELAPAPVKAPVFTPPPLKIKTTHNRQVTRYDFQIIDPNQVPRQFCSVDEKKIRAYIAYQKQIKQEPVITGVVFSKLVSVESK